MRDDEVRAVTAIHSNDKVAALDLFAQTSSYVYKETICGKSSSAGKLNSCVWTLTRKKKGAKMIEAFRGEDS
jgi:hypothetical protein